MKSPSSELNAYIIEHKAQKILRSSINSSASSRTDSHKTHSSYLSRRHAWLQDVLTMPKKSAHSYENNSIMRKSPTKFDTGSVSKWLDEIDQRIAERFPIKTDELDTASNETSFDKSGPYEKDDDMKSKSLASICSSHSMSYDSHPNMSEIKLMCTKETYDLDSDETVKYQEPINLCESCKIERVVSPNNTYKNTQHEKSIPLPMGYQLLNAEKPKKAKKKKKVKSHTNTKNIDNESDVTPTPTANSTLLVEPTNQDTTNSKIQLPGNGEVMQLLEKAIGQLNEVKVAVEENTVSAITASTVSINSNILSEFGEERTL